MEFGTPTSDTSSAFYFCASKSTTEQARAPASCLQSGRGEAGIGQWILASIRNLVRAKIGPLHNTDPDPTNSNLKDCELHSLKNITWMKNKRANQCASAA
eukprot:s2802_g4.t1